MKRLALLSMVSLMLASAVFAPVAIAQEPGEVDVQSVNLGPGGSVTVAGTIECVQGSKYFVAVDVSQRTSGNVDNLVQLAIEGTCETTGPTDFTMGPQFSDRPFHMGPATIQARSSLSSQEWQGGAEAVRIGSVAITQEPGEVDVQEVNLGPGGSVTAAGTFECVEGYFYSVDVEVRQTTSGNVYNLVQVFTTGTCATTEQIAFTTNQSTEIVEPFHKGPVTIRPILTLCAPDGSLCEFRPAAIETISIR